MQPRILRLLLLAACASAALAPAGASAQSLNYQLPYLHSIFPAGGKQGSEVPIELWGAGVHAGEHHVLIEGAPGVTVSDIKLIYGGRLGAKLTIAADAPPGRRLVRVHNISTGLTNFRYFFVGTLPETLEIEPNNTVDVAQPVELPVVVNAHINPTLDTDTYRFQAKAGQKLVAAVLSHGMDCFADYLKGYLDTNLELRDERGNVVATAEDSLGVDPLIHATIPADGQYTLQVRSLGFKGSPYAVYRLTIGEVPYPTAIFPPGGKRGTTIDAEISGPNVPPGTREQIVIPADGSIPTHAVTLAGPAARVLQVARGDFAEMIEHEPNDRREAAEPLILPIVANGRFLTGEDEDWYRITLEQGKGVLLQTVAQRQIDSPADMELQIFDSTGQKLAENDDGAAFGGYVQCAHDFVSNDCFLPFTAAKSGEYFIRVRNLSSSHGTRATYRLHAEPLVPDFLLYQWPAEVPIWGPGTTATFIVEIVKWGALAGDVTLEVIGLPAGWKGSTVVAPGSYYPTWNTGTGAIKYVVSITAPADAKIGAIAPFRVIGRAEHEGRQIEHEGLYMTLYGNSHNDRMHVRYTPTAMAAVADYLDSTVTTEVTELTLHQGQATTIPIVIKRRPGVTHPIGVVVNGPTPSAGCGLGPPVTLAGGEEQFAMPLNVSPDHAPGIYGIVVARSWSSDIRNGRPGPCTPIIKLTVLPKK